MSSRGVVDSPAILAVTSTRMSEGRPAMAMPERRAATPGRSPFALLR
jgi:hypothetical protein